MYTKSGKRLGGSLTETDVTQFFGLGNLENVIDRVRDVVPCKIIYAVQKSDVKQFFERRALRT